MQRPTDNDADESSRPPSSSTPAQPRRGGAPLVIVSERGRHSEESRRIVRAQAARASAAQSRVTRARNREEREGPIRESPVSPVQDEPIPVVEPPAAESTGSAVSNLIDMPLVRWLSSALNTPPTGLLSLTSSTLTGVTTNVASTAGGLLGGLGSGLGSGLGLGSSTFDIARPQLPRAIPRGFAILQQRIQISDSLMALLGRSSCFDFDSPGVEERLHQLLIDLIVGQLTNSLTLIPMPGHSIQGHLRIACTCLTIFQGQRADGEVFAANPKYDNGLEAAWSEVMLLDQNALAEPKSAEASLWAVFIINVTTGSTVDFFCQLLHNLFEDLQLQYWSQVRSILLDFIYPVSFLDEPCKTFFNKVQELRPAVVA